MFLGQMLEAIRIRGKFNMSSGKQLRQFHHTSDVVQAVYSLLPDIKENSVLQVSSKQSIRLADLASTIFSQRGELGSLEIGSMNDPENEVYSDVYPVPESLKSHDFRNPLIEIPKLVSDVWLPKQLH
jgi:nucleoside-diphosphate-sugar epimerase